jgi:hypothetical protein
VCAIGARAEERDQGVAAVLGAQLDVIGDVTEGRERGGAERAADLEAVELAVAREPVGGEVAAVVAGGVRAAVVVEPEPGRPARGGGGAAQLAPASRWLRRLATSAWKRRAITGRTRGSITLERSLAVSQPSGNSHPPRIQEARRSNRAPSVRSGPSPGARCCSRRQARASRSERWS